MTTRRRHPDIERAMIDPAAVFSTPEDVVTCEDLGAEQKAGVLTAWAYDAREMEVAEEEGMEDGTPDLLARIHRALRSLGKTPDGEHTPPTKQGGESL